MKKIMLFGILWVSFLLFSGCEQKTDFEKSFNLIQELTEEMTTYYWEKLSPSQLNYDEQTDFVYQEDNSYQREDIRSSWINDTNSRMDFGLKELDRLEDIITEHEFTTFEEIKSYNAARYCFVSNCTDVAHYDLSYIGDDHIALSFTSSDGEAFDIKAGYTNPSLFKRHKMHLIYASNITNNDNDLAFYREFIEDVRIIEMSYDKEDNRIEHVEYTDLKSFKVYGYNPEYITAYEALTNYRMSYIDIKTGVVIEWLVGPQDYYVYVVNQYKSYLTRSFMYAESSFQDDVEITYNLANYKGWKSLSIDGGQSNYRIYDDDYQLIDFMLNQETNERLMFNNGGTIATLQLIKYYDKESITSEDITLKSFGLSSYDDEIDLEFIDNHRDHTWFLEYEFYKNMRMSDIVLEDLLIFIDDEFVSNFLD